MLQNIDELTDKSLQISYYNSLSMNEIFPDDLLQFILSFVGFYNEKGVNKKWKNLSEKNESLYLKQLYKTVLTEGKFSAAGGAGLGLIDIGRKSSEPLEYGFIPFNENYSFFSLNVKINQ